VFHFSDNIFFIFKANLIAQLSPSGEEKELNKIVSILECLSAVRGNISARAN
jgi:hypothetical protein